MAGGGRRSASSLFVLMSLAGSAALLPVPIGRAMAAPGIAAASPAMSGNEVSWGSGASDPAPGSAPTAIAGGEYFALVLKAGQVVAWGSDSANQIDVPADAGSGVTAIAAGAYHGLAVKAGAVVAWGYGNNGQTTVPPAAQSGVTAVAAGTTFSVALTGGQVVEWGGTWSTDHPVPAAALSGVTSIAAGPSKAIAIAGGRVIVWGDNAWPSPPAETQSGVSAVAAGADVTMALKGGRVIEWSDSTGAELAVPAEAGSGVTAIAASGQRLLALRAGHVIEWGDLSDNTNTDLSLGGVTAIAAGSGFGLAVRDGEVRAWGTNPTVATRPLTEPLHDITAIAAGTFFNVALKQGRVLAWGMDAVGETEVPAAARSGVTAIAAGVAHGLALKNGRVLAWGDNGDAMAAVPKELDTGVTAITTFNDENLALKSGRVVAWGSGVVTPPPATQAGVSAINGQMALKDGGVIAWGDNTWHQTEVPVDAQSGVTAVADGGEHKLALKGGRVIAWGEDLVGETDVPSDALSGVTAIAASSFLSLALKDGHVIAWGIHGYGGTTIPAAAMHDVIAISAGGPAVAAISTSAPVAPDAGDYRPLVPARLLETRSGMPPTVDGSFSGYGKSPADSTVVLRVEGRGGVPDRPSAVVLNVTVTEPEADGFVTVYPCGDPRPNTSSLNYRAGQTVANLVVSAVGFGARGPNGYQPGVYVCIYTQAATHLVVDVSGAYPLDGTYDPLAPARLLDTRPGAPTIDGQGSAAGLRVAGSTVHVHVTGRAGVPADATAVVLNTTVTEPNGDGFVTVWPCGQHQPLASNLNYGAGQTIANLVIAKVGAGGDVCLFTQQATHLIADVAGYFPPAVAFRPLLPARVLETRTGAGHTIDRLDEGIGVRTAGSTTTLHLRGRGGVLGGASSVVLNVTATGPQSAGYLTLWPCDRPRPNASNVNYGPGQTIPNLVIVKLSAGGDVCVFTQSATDVVVDVNGYS